MKQKSFCLFMSALIFPSVLLAQVQRLDLVLELKKTTPAISFDSDKNLKKKPLNELARLKWFLINKMWKDCARESLALSKKNKLIADWILRAGLQCALELDEKEASRKSLLSSLFETVKEDFLYGGTSSEELKEVWVNAGLAMRPQKNIRLLQNEALLTKSQKSLIYDDFAEQALSVNKKSQALFYFRLSYENSPLVKTLQKIQSLEDPKSEKLRDESESSKELGAESEAESAIVDFEKNNDKESLFRVMVDTLNRFPQGRFSKKYRGRIPEVLIEAQEKNAPYLENLLQFAMTAHASRLTEWSESLHRRGYDEISLRLTEKALQSSAESALASKLYWMAGRSALFLGLDDRAVVHFDQVVQFHRQSDEYLESLFRLALLQFKLERAQVALRLFDRLLEIKENRYEVWASYWRIRSLEKLKHSDFLKERDLFIERYPMTYYGLVLRAEKNEGKVIFSAIERSPLETQGGELWLVGDQSKSWAKFKLLAQAGWTREALQELKLIPLPQTPWALVLWSRLMSLYRLYGPASMALNKATELEQTLRALAYQKDVFPKAFEDLVVKESVKNSVQPTLIFSLMRQESLFDPFAVSRSQAMGLMQLMPMTAREVADELKITLDPQFDLFDPRINIALGTRYLTKMIRDFDDSVPLALAAYNAGPTRLKRWIEPRRERLQDELWIDELPWFETSFYVKAIMRNVILNQVIDQGPVIYGPEFMKRMIIKNQTESDDKKKK